MGQKQTSPSPSPGLRTPRRELLETRLSSFQGTRRTKTMNRLPSILLGALIFLLSSSPNFAQRTAGSIAGLVTDASQAAVPGAEVVVRNLATETERRTVT